MYPRVNAQKKPTISAVTLVGYPPFMQPCFDLLKAAGANYYALFGGAVRDADYMARHNQHYNIKDYDLRIWLPKDNYQQRLSLYLAKLGALIRGPIESTPCPGTDQVHYCFLYNGIELDVSVRPIPDIFQDECVPMEAVACERASSSDVAISGVAIDALGRSWAQADYLHDQINKTLTVYLMNDSVRRHAYLTRMGGKFPHHRVIWGIDKAPTAIFFDFDDVCHNPNRDDIKIKNSYQVKPDGSVYGELIDPAQLRKIAQYAKEKHIPLYIITARPETHKTYIFDKIAEIDGFYYDGIGGFKKENIHCLGLETFDETLKRLHVSDLICSKIVKIQAVHQSELSYLPRSHLLFSDDELRNTEPVKRAGYSIILAKGGLNSEHLHTILHIMHTRVDLAFIISLGNFAVLGKLTALLDPPLDETEYLEPAIDAELQGMYWRKRMLPHFSALAQKGLKDPAHKSQIANQLESLSYKQAIFFTNNPQKIAQYVLEHSFGTINSVENLAQKDFIILLGSEGRRKVQPLLRALSFFPHLDVAVIGMPADSGVDTQPVGHEQILEGAKNRLDQLHCFREALGQFLENIATKKIPIACLAIENGIGLFPIESVDHHGRMHIAMAPLLLEDDATYCFYDQAHMLFDVSGQIYYEVSRPMKIGYTFLNQNKEELVALLGNKNKYYQVQSEFAHEMLLRIKAPELGSPFPVCKEGPKIVTSDDQIQGILDIWFRDFFTEKRSMSRFKDAWCFFKTIENRYLEENRSTDSAIQHEYDKRFGLVVRQSTSP